LFTDPDLDIKIEIDEVNLTMDKETHNKPEPLTSKAGTGLRPTTTKKTNQSNDPRVDSARNKQYTNSNNYTKYNDIDNHVEASKNAGATGENYSSIDKSSLHYSS
jgi:hypothetical protein